MDHKRKILHFSLERVWQINALAPLMLLSEEIFILIQIVDEESSYLTVHNFTQILTFHWKIFYQHFCIHCREDCHFRSVKIPIYHCSCFYWQFQVFHIIHGISHLCITDILFFYSYMVVTQYYIKYIKYSTPRVRFVMQMVLHHLHP